MRRPQQVLGPMAAAKGRAAALSRRERRSIDVELDPFEAGDLAGPGVRIHFPPAESLQIIGSTAAEPIGATRTRPVSKKLPIPSPRRTDQLPGHPDISPSAQITSGGSDDPDPKDGKHVPGSRLTPAVAAN